MHWLWYVVCSILFFTTLNIVQRKVAVNSENPRVSAFLFTLTAFVILLIIYILTGAYRSFSFPTNPLSFFVVGFAVCAYGLFERLRFVAAKLLEASLLVTIINLSVLITFVGSVVLYSEPLTIPKLFGFILILSSLLLVSFKPSHTPASRKGILYGVLISVLLGIAWLADKKGVELFEVQTYSLFVWSLPLLIIFPPSIPLRRIKVEAQKSLKWIIVMAALNVFGYLCQMKAFQVADASVVVPLIHLSLLLTVLFGVVVLKERENWKLKLIAGILALIGAYFLV